MNYIQNLHEFTVLMDASDLIKYLYLLYGTAVVVIKKHVCQRLIVDFLVHKESPTDGPSCWPSGQSSALYTALHDKKLYGVIVGMSVIILAYRSHLLDIGFPQCALLPGPQFLRFYDSYSQPTWHFSLVFYKLCRWPWFFVGLRFITDIILQRNWFEFLTEKYLYWKYNSSGLWSRRSTVCRGMISQLDVVAPILYAVHFAIQYCRNFYSIVYQHCELMVEALKLIKSF